MSPARAATRPFSRRKVEKYQGFTCEPSRCRSERSARRRSHQPKTIIFWGQEDVFFTPAGGEAYLQDLPDAEMHRLQAGHFAVEDHLDYITDQMVRFYDERVAGAPPEG